MRPTFSVLVITHNRAETLRETLLSLVRMASRDPWEVIVVDNNSDDQTHSVVSDVARTAAISVRYMQETRPGKYLALNTGIQCAAGDFIACTDDDAFPHPDWLDRAAEGFGRFGCDFVGGPVYPIWRRPPPGWLAKDRSVYQKVLALQDHGTQALEYGRGISWPLGVNVAYRRGVFGTAGLFDGRLGRVAGTLRNQAQREWHLRARAAGARGFYLPQMVVDHIVAADRLEKQYFRRWFYWHGISRALLCRNGGLDVEEPESMTHSGERRLLGLPLSVYPKALRSARSLVWHSIRRDASAFEYELWLWFFAGLLRESLKRHGHAPVDPAPLSATNSATARLHREHI
jgi:glycosyltransferase involved in cell wall biosynthesis